MWLPYAGVAAPFAVHEICRAVVPLICFEIVESYAPNRVLRQFGMEQHIPRADFDTRLGLHLHVARGTHGLAAHIRDWAERIDRVHTGAPSEDVYRVRVDYWEWYRAHTRHLIGNPQCRQANSEGYYSTGASQILLVSIFKLM